MTKQHYATKLLIAIIFLASTLVVIAQDTHFCCCQNNDANPLSTIGVDDSCPPDYNKIPVSPPGVGEEENICAQECGVQQTDAICGDNAITGIEQCESTKPIDKTCADLDPTTTGKLTCFPKGHENQCTFDTSECEQTSIDCNTPNTKPQIQALTAEPVKGEKRVLLKYNTVCNPESVTIQRCQGSQCKDFKEIAKGKFSEYTDQDDALKWKEVYSYKIIANYPSGASPPSKPASILLGDIECWKKTTNQAFCLNMLTYKEREIKEYLETKGYGKIQFSPDNFETTILENFGINFNQPRACGPANTIERIKDANGNTKNCNKEQACTNDGLVTCVNQEPCHSSPFSIFSNTELCEGPPRKYCYYDRSDYLLNDCFQCVQTMKCYDYKTKNACERDNCGIGGGNCEWKNTMTDISIGACINKEEDNCDYCSQKGTTLFAIKAHNEIFDICTEQKTNALSTQKNECLFNPDTATAKSCAKAVCADIKPERCGTQQITLNGKNEIITKSQDQCGLGICQLTTAVSGREKCVKNADGSTEPPIADCYNKGPECEQDITPAQTSVFFTKTKGLVSDINFVITDNTTRQGNPINPFSKQATLKDGYTIYMCAETNEQNCNNAKEYTAQTTKNKIIVNNLNLFDGQNNIAGLKEGTNTLHFYTRDSANNLEVVKSAMFNACNNCQGPRIVSIEPNEGRVINNKIFTSNRDPKFIIKFTNNSKIKLIKLTDQTGKSAIITITNPEGSGEYLITHIATPETLLGNYTLEIQAESEQGRPMEEKYAIQIVVDPDQGQLSIQPTGEQNNRDQKIIITSTKPAFLQDATLTETHFLSKFTKSTTTTNITAKFEEITELFEYQATIHLGDGPKKITAKAERIGSNKPLTAFTTFTVGNENPKILLAKPEMGLPDSNVFTIEINTNRKSECRYRVNIPLTKLDADTDSEFNTLIKMNPSQDELAHTVQSFTLPDDKEHTLYVACKTKTGNRIAIEEFTLQKDNTPPKIIKTFTNPHPIAEKHPDGDFETTLNVETDDLTFCKYSTEQTTSFEQMTKFIGNDTTPTKNHNSSYRTNDSERIYIECKGATGSIKTQLDIIIRLEPLSITVLSPRFTPGTTPLIENPIEITTNHLAVCTYREVGDNNENTCVFDGKLCAGQTKTTGPITREHHGRKNAKIFTVTEYETACANLLGETATTKFLITTGHTGAGEELTITPKGQQTNENINLKIESARPFKIDDAILEETIYVNKFFKTIQNTTITDIKPQGQQDQQSNAKTYAKNLRLKDGPKKIYAKGKDFLDIDVQGTAKFSIASKAPTILLLAPEFGSSSTPNIELKIETSREAQCVFQLDGNAPAITDFNNRQQLTTQENTIHQTQLQIAEGIHQLYVICKSQQANANLFMNETFDIYIDTTPPMINSVFAEPNPIAEENLGGQLETVLTIETDDITRCRYDTTNKPYNEMQNEVSTIPSKTHEKSIFVQQDKATFNYFVACQNVAGLTGQTQEISFSTNTQLPLIITVKSPAQVLSQNLPINITTNKNSTCTHNNISCAGTEQDQKATFSTFGRKHKGTRHVNHVGVYCLLVECTTPLGEKTTAQFTITSRDSVDFGLTIQPNGTQNKNKIDTTIEAEQQLKHLDEAKLTEKEIPSPYISRTKTTDILADFKKTTNEKKFTQSIDFKPGFKEIKAKATNFLNELLGGTGNFTVTQGELSIAMTNPFFGYTNESPFTLMIETNLPSNCSYAFNIPTPPTSIEGLPKLTTQDGYTHSANEFKLTDQTPKTLHVMCQSSTKTKTQTYQLQLDLTPPIIELSAEPPLIVEPIIPGQNQYSTQLIVESKPDHNGRTDLIMCNYDTENKPYEQMLNEFEGTKQNPNKIVSTEIIVTEDKKTYQHFVTCKNPAGMNSSTQTINFSVDTSIPFGIELRSIQFSNTSKHLIRFLTNKRAQCTIEQETETPQTISGITKNHEKEVQLKLGTNTYKIKCNTLGGEQESKTIAIIFDNTPPDMKNVNDSTTNTNPEISTFTDHLQLSFIGEEKESSITKYLINLSECLDEQCTKTTTQTTTQSQRSDGTKETLTGLGLKDKTKYLFLVRAENNLGLLSIPTDAQGKSDGVFVDTSGLPAHCSNKKIDLGESDKDCGGECTFCQINQTCRANTDCGNNLCVQGKCQAPSCNDKIQTPGFEIGIDCGNKCPPCPDPGACKTNTDCPAESTCQNGECKGGGCTTNQNCPSQLICKNKQCIAGCSTDKPCATNFQCINDKCQQETNSCTTDTQCKIEFFCSQTKCVKGCSDNTRCLPTFICSQKQCITDACGKDLDCLQGEKCISGACKTGNCNDGARSFDETDIDCGGACQKCENGKHCTTSNDCANANCNGGTCGGINPNQDNDGDGVPNPIDQCPNTPLGKKVNPNTGCGLDDADKDGISDDWEVTFGLNPNEDDSLKDPDNDNIPNIDEFLRRTDPNKKDSDADGISDINDKCPSTPKGTKVDQFGCGPDTDRAGIPDEWEISFGLNPNNSQDERIDSDGDGLANIDEFLKGSDPKVKDSDRDGVNDDKDKCPRTPTGTIIDADGCGLADKDKDGISDDWETNYGLNPNDSQDALIDTDKDGLANIDEFLKGSDPKVKDSDRDGVNDDKDKCPRTPTGTIIDADGCGLADKDKDGISDDWEAQFGLDPTEPSDALKDIDDDGLPAIDEFNKGTNPNKKDSDKDGTDDATDKCPNTPTNAKTGKDGCQTKDTDNDGMPDEWEINFGLNPNNPNDATTDTDGDGLANIIEYKKGTNPSKPDTDKDGVIDKDDRCPNTPRGTAVNIKGCSKTDTDNDGMPDEWEQDNELNPEENDAKKDNDNDGLTNKEEYEANTLPKDKNTDNGKATDGEEIDENTDPLDPSDDLVRTPKTTLILSIAGILLLLALSALLAHYLSHKKRKYEPPHLPEYEPLKKETIQTLKEVAKSETLLEKIQKLKAKEGSIERLRSHAKTGIEKLQEIKPAGIERLKPKKGSIEQLRKETLKKKTK